MNIEKKLEGSSLTLKIEGRLDTVTAPELEAAINEHIQGLTSLTMDFGGVEYVSSAGLRVILSAQKAMSRQGEMVLTNVRSEVDEVFEITGFKDILTIR